MHHRLRTRDSGDLLVAEAHTLASGAEITDVEDRFEHELGRGYSRGIVLDGVVLVQGMHTVTRDVVLQSEQDPASIELHVALQGDVVVHVQGLRDALRFRPGTHVLHYAPASRLHFALTSNVRYERFEMNLTTGYMASLAARYPELLGEVFSQVDRQQPFCLDPTGRIVTADMHRVLRQILRSEMPRPVRRMFIEAKILELLALALQQRDVGVRRATDLTRREVDRMVEARDCLLAHLDDPPTLHELARQVGTNEFTLKRDFKAVFGTTVYGLLRDHRMAYAQVLLLDTDRPISDIAREVGYRHTAHFSTAFKKTVGVPPSTFRKGR